MHKDSGMTLIELVVAIAVLGILTAAAVPVASHWVPNYRVKGAARDLVSNFQRARVEAVRQSIDVVIEVFPHAYTPDGGVGSYRISVDDNPRNGVFDAGEAILVQETMIRDVSLYLADFSGGTITGFNSTGLPISNRWGNIQLRNNQSRYYRLSLSCAGHVRLRMSSDGSTWN
jgi:type IV fimbrial biogenesis protein FimT